MIRELLEKEAFGMVEIYYGEANGKTRLCTGTAIKAALKKKNVLMVSFGEDYDDYSGLFEIAPHITRLTLPANAGVREYWIADPMHETVTTFDFRRNDIVMKMYTFEDKVPVGIYDNQFTIDFKEIRDSYAFLDDAEDPE